EDEPRGGHDECGYDRHPSPHPPEHVPFEIGEDIPHALLRNMVLNLWSSKPDPSSLDPTSARNTSSSVGSRTERECTVAPRSSSQRKRAGTFSDPLSDEKSMTSPSLSPRNSTPSGSVSGYFPDIRALMISFAIWPFNRDGESTATTLPWSRIATRSQE